MDYLTLAYQLAQEGRGRVEPNPMVGAVIVSDGAVVGRGAHRCFGGPHAEVEALREAGRAARGATIFVTLEPCSTLGKTPPCVEALVAAGITEVVYAVDDPNPDHAGRAVALLEAKGILVRREVDPEAGRDLLRRFDVSGTRGRPFIVAKWAQTIGGATVTPDGEPPEISGAESRTRVHADRATCCGILVGAGTALADDPELTTRLVDGPSPRRFILDSSLQVPAASRVFQLPPATMVFCSQAADRAKRAELQGRGVTVCEVGSNSEGLDLQDVMGVLSSEGVQRLFVEGGAGVHRSFFAQGLVDHVQVYIAGGVDAPDIDEVVRELTSRFALSDILTQHCGDDLLLTGYSD